MGLFHWLKSNLFWTIEKSFLTHDVTGGRTLIFVYRRGKKLRLRECLSGWSAARRSEFSPCSFLLSRDVLPRDERWPDIIVGRVRASRSWRGGFALVAPDRPLLVPMDDDISARVERTAAAMQAFDGSEGAMLELVALAEGDEELAEMARGSR
jgi:hypothetical protein